jgi:hypothetical protein
LARCPSPSGASEKADEERIWLYGDDQASLTREAGSRERE